MTGLSACFLLGILFLPQAFDEGQSMASPLGIFEATAFWNPALTSSHPDFNIRPGRVEMEDMSGNKAYRLLSNGDGHWDGNDQNVFMYAERTGSWQFTAHLQWIDRGGGSEGHEKVGLMIREFGPLGEAKHFFCHLHSGMTQPLNDFVEIQWQTQPGSFPFHYFETLGQLGSVPSRRDRGTYLRLTRIVPLNLFIAEMSEDGLQWQLLHELQMEMANQVAYGLALSLEGGLDQFTQARATHVSLTPAPPIVRRRITPAYTRPGQEHSVTLEIYNPQPTPRETFVREIIPKGWRVKLIPNGGRQEQEALIWDLVAAPGSTLWGYTVIAATETVESVTFTGRIGDREVFGDRQIQPVIREIWERPPLQWVTWGTADGLPDQQIRRVIATPYNTVLVQFLQGDNLVILDGYASTRIPNPVYLTGFYPAVIQNAAGQIWSVSRATVDQPLTGFQRYEKGNWVFHAAPIGSMDDGSYSFTSDRENRLVFHTNDAVYEFDAITGATALIADVTHSSLSRFHHFLMQPSDDIWLAGNHGLMKLSRKDEGGGWEKEEYPLPEEIRHNSPYVGLPKMNPKGEITVSVWPPDPSLMVWDKQQWREVYRLSGNRSLSGYWKEDGTLWTFEYLKEILRRVARDQEEVIRDASGHPWLVRWYSADRSGAIWVGNRNKVARDTPLLWQSPPPAAGLHQPVYSICEDSIGSLWFAAQEYLIRRKDEEWAYYPMTAPFIVMPPSNPPTFPTLGPLPDGRIAVSGYGIDSHWGTQFCNLWAWTPEQERWESIREGIGVHGIVPGRRGQILLRTLDNKVETFDGKQFQNRMALGGQADVNQPESLLETRNGDLWVGTGSELLRVQGELVERFGLKEGYQGGRLGVWRK